MTGLVPVIHDWHWGEKDVDGRDKHGHDGRNLVQPTCTSAVRSPPRRSFPEGSRPLLLAALPAPGLPALRSQQLELVAPSPAPRVSAARVGVAAPGQRLGPEAVLAAWVAPAAAWD
jgi:hypothetical protein